MHRADPRSGTVKISDSPGSSRGREFQWDRSRLHQLVGFDKLISKDGIDVKPMENCVSSTDHPETVWHIGTGVGHFEA